MSVKNKEQYSPRIIRTLGSQSLSGPNVLRPSTLSSTSQPLSTTVRIGTPVSGIQTQGSANSSITMTQNIVSNTPLSAYNTTEVSTPGSSVSTYRVAQACDRCRAKKTRCDGKRPQCSQCAAVGFECKISDKLSRRAFPRGYTETLEERVRELEAENRRLVAICDLKEEQLHLVSKYDGSQKKDDSIDQEEDQMLKQLTGLNGGVLHVSSTNLYLLHKKSLLHDTSASATSTHINSSPHHTECNGACSNYHNHPHLHEKPVSTNLNDPTSISFEQNEAPGLSTVKALNSLKSHQEGVQLAALVALSTPRTTDEILFIPQLLARIGQVHGFTSKQCLYTASLLSSLKEILPQKSHATTEHLTFKSLWEIDDIIELLEAVFRFKFTESIKNDVSGLQDDTYLNSEEIKDLICLFFKDCYNIIPLFDKSEFERYMNKFIVAVNDPTFFKKDNNIFSKRSKLISYKIFSSMLLTVIQLGLITKVKSENLKQTKYNRLIQYYDGIILQLSMNPYFTAKTTSIQSLQCLSLALFYFLNVGNVPAIYEIRGKVVTMSQQLRLHRCPSAVLGINGSTVSKVQQCERRLLFWGIYYLDVFSSLQLGVPRLVKDHEIECALPLSLDEENAVDSSNQVITLEGRVSPFSLSMIRFGKVLGNILDSIFKRSMSASLTKHVALVHENALDNWRRGLPENLKFQLDVNGTINMDEFNHLRQLQLDTSIPIQYEKESLVLIILYFMAKYMIHLPVVSTKPLTNDSTQFPNQVEETTQIDRSSSSYILLQQATNTLLNILSSAKNVYISLPISISRTIVRLGLSSARGSLEYTKGGALFQDNKALLVELVKELEADCKLNLPGTLTWHSLKLFDMAINLILQPPNTRTEKLDKMLQKKLNYYNKMEGRAIPLNDKSSVLKEEATFSINKRTHSEEEIGMDPRKLTPISNKSDSPNEKRLKLKNYDNISPLKFSENKGSDHITMCMSNDESKPIKGTLTSVESNPIPSGSNAITEAFQLDPVLNNEFFYGSDLQNIFHEDIIHNKTQDTQTLDQAKSISIPTSEHKDSKYNHISDTNINLSEGLFKVPSNVDFLKEYYLNEESHSSSRVKSMSVNSELQKSSHDLHQPEVGFAVDASLGLAPLLSWHPTQKYSVKGNQMNTATQVGSYHIQDKSTNTNNGIILDTTDTDKDDKLVQVRSFTDAKKIHIVPTLLSNNEDNTLCVHTPYSASISFRKKHRHEDAFLTPTHDYPNDDDVISIGKRTHRGPRHRWNSLTDTNKNDITQCVNGNISNVNTSSVNVDEAITDLFRWQNNNV